MGMSARRRLVFAFLAVTSAATGITPAAADARPARIGVSFPTAPDGTPVQLPRALNDRGEVLGVTGDSLTTVVWRRGRVSVVGTAGTVLDGRDLSDRGHVGGLELRSFTDVRPFVWRGGRLTYLPTDRAIGAVVDVNDHGTALGAQGDSITASDQVVGWVDGALVTPPPGVVIEPAFAYPTVLNDRDQAAVDLIVDGRRQAAVWDLDTNGITMLGTLGGTSSSVVAINDAGDVTGVAETASGESHAFLWRRGHMTDLGTLGGRNSTPRGLNDRGDVIGTSGTAGGTIEAFLWRDGRLSLLPSLGGTSSVPASQPVDINDRGQVVGESTTPGGATHAVLWEQGGVVDLGARLDTTANSAVVGINERGQVLGQVFSAALGASVIWST
jgi:probable HAF family extracellular repeat protein